MNDTEAVVLTATPTKDGWRTSTLQARGRHQEVLIAPDGTRYVRAEANEQADLLVDMRAKYPSVDVMRWRKEQGSRLARSAKREQRIVRRGERAKERQTQADAPPAEPRHVRRKR